MSTPSSMKDDDFAARDVRITCLSYASVGRREGIPPDAFALYWRDVHGPLCARIPGLGFYVQHHFSRDHAANLWPLADGVRHMDLVLDGGVEIGFANMADQTRFAEASKILFADEFNFIGHAVAYSLPNGSKTYVDRQADGVPNGPDKLHRLHLYLNGSPDEAFRHWAAAFAAQLATSPAVQKLRLHLPEPYSNDHPQPPSPNVDHIVSDERKNLAVIEIAFETPLAARAFFATELYQATVEEQSKYVRSLGVFLVTGVYTYVRDGIVTTAGLRGSRAAEMIEQLGAVNQLNPTVANLFRNDHAL